ncbi:MAG: response regulator [Candidatus Zambryskibacteria bacterium]|nr:response regulator [Candidatus Zambryskibacteria bacterium]
MTEETVKKILIADDEEAYRMLLANGLVDAGFLVLQAKDGNEALRLAKEEHPDIVLLDIKMPGRDGIEILDELYKELGDNVPIFMLTQMSDMDTIAKAASKHALGYFIKSEHPIEYMVEQVKKRLYK